MPFMYILECADGSFYVGSTVDLETRLEQHHRGEGAGYTKRRLPVELVYFEECGRIDDAFAREKQVQGWGRAKRIALIEGRLGDLPGLSRSRGGLDTLDHRSRVEHTGLDKLDHRGQVDRTGLDRLGHRAGNR